uniref:RNA polymerase II associated protein 1 n=1 Tax=Callorhinchus milii TaxID=7868 RepID=A0A4W3JW70_CALMI|eukprot:gi/632944866/ref/XP_007887734.1/ PREDICTED: RNA polymerase II-associated protein 1 [Callorhinchus milii]
MLGRPRPGESEDDLLRFQQEFLRSGASPAVTVVKKADKRKVESENVASDGKRNEEQRDKVTLEGLPDLPPTLQPAPPKKSRLKPWKVQFEEDIEASMEQQDQHIMAVLPKVIERDTSNMPISFPLSTGLAFPKVFHRSEMQSEVPGDFKEAQPPSGKKSIFAQKFAAKKAAEQARTAPGPCPTPQGNRGQRASGSCLTGISQEIRANRNSPASGGQRYEAGKGAGGRMISQEAQSIHTENVARLQAMSEEEIEQERKNLLMRLDPGLVAFLKSRKSGRETARGTEDEMEITRTEQEQSQSKAQPSPDEEEPKDVRVTEDNLPFKPEKNWVHMHVPEPEKLEWMKDLPKPRKRKTKKAMQARFSFRGDLIPADTDLPTHLGLHHHGQEPEEAGYSLQELFHLSRSQVIQQRTLALQTLAHIVQKAKDGVFSSSIKPSLLAILLDAGFLFLVRFSLDDSADNVIAACVQALRALLVSPGDEEYLDQTFSWYLGAGTFPLLPNEVEEDDDDEEEELRPTGDKQPHKPVSKDEKKPDPDVAHVDIIKGLLKMKVLHRLRYILEVVRPVPSVVTEIFDILIRIARHSSEACSQIVECPRLMETIVREFLPATWSVPALEEGQMVDSIYGLPSAAAMKLLRVLASAGRHMSAILLNKYKLKGRIGRFLAEDPGDLALEEGDSCWLCTEALRLWAVAASYAQACDLYKDLYPVLVKILQKLPSLVAPSARGDALRNCSSQRAEALVILLVNVTNTAGCSADLHAQLTCSVEDKTEHIPPPPVNWSHVAGIKPFLLACLKSCLRDISCSEIWGAKRQLTSTYMIYLAAYYSKLPQQPSYRPVECLEELETFSSEVLLPLLKLPAVQNMFEDLISCSALCNPTSCSPGPETIYSLVSLSCAGGKPPLSLLGARSPFSFLTALLCLINSICSAHKGLVQQFSVVLQSKALRDYLNRSSKGTPPVTHASAWLLRHEFHFQFQVLKLASKVIAVDCGLSLHAPLYHYVTMTLLSRLLPGSEHLAHELLSGLAFNQDLIPEGKSGGPEAEDLRCILRLGTDQDPGASAHPSPTRGTLLAEAFKQLPSIRAGYLAQLAQLRPALLQSQACYKGNTHSVSSLLLPEMTGPLLPADWAFLPLITLYERASREELRGQLVGSLPPGLVAGVTGCLQWLLLLETWRDGLLRSLAPAAKLARLTCVFLTGSDLFLERPVHDYLSALLATFCQPSRMAALDLGVPLPGLSSFYDLYVDLLQQFESVSFGDHLFGCFLLLPLQRRFSVQLREAVFGEHVGVLRALGVPLNRLPVPLEAYTRPTEGSLGLLRQYFKTLVTGTLRLNWCPVLYAVAVAHVNGFIFSQETVDEAFDAARRSMLRKAYLLTDEALRKHLLYYKLPNIESRCGFDMYEDLPAIRDKWMRKVLGERVYPRAGEQGV